MYNAKGVNKYTALVRSLGVSQQSPLARDVENAQGVNVSQHPLAHEISNPTAKCIQSSSFEEMVNCFDTYTVFKDIYTEQTYKEAQPTSSERAAWLSTITSLLDVDGNCLTTVVPPILKDIYRISQFNEASGASYCILSEITAYGIEYGKGWGIFITPATRAAVSRQIHLSAPHPSFDSGTPQQAGALFKSTGAKSLLIAGRSRLSFRIPSPCVPSTPKTTYYITDPAHDKGEPFYDASRSIYKWQSDNGGCPTESCAFVQFHAKGPSTCRTDQIFVSAGLGGNDAPSKAWYLDDVSRPAKRLTTQLRSAFPAWNVSTPTDSPCLLTATKNIVGRFLNGVDDGHVCTTNANASRVTGLFVHIEQSKISLAPEAHGAWTTALVDTFEPVRE
ncbi:hypothetical protein DXG01_004790 [Tephrocybe rancida]|nr:hypothetical protein DXG01_004790 [Tephrocybe rancida]